MGRNHRRAIGLTTAGLTTASLIFLLVPRGLSARTLFDSRPLNQASFAVLAQPVGSSDWKLLVLEQIKRSPRCWTPRPDGLVEPTLNRFDFAGICSRYLDSNSYSLRSGGEDLGTRFRLRLQQRGSTLRLEAIDPREAAPIPIGRGSVSRRDRNGFVLLQLDRDWQLERRVYKGRTLGHVYFANSQPVNTLLTKAGGSDIFASLGGTSAPTAPPPITPSVEAPIQTAMRRPVRRRTTRVRRMASRGPISLPVIPYRR